MIEYEFKENLDEKLYDILGEEFEKFSAKNEIKCDYTSFAFIAKDGENIAGIIVGHSYYKEVYIQDLIVLEQYRNQNIGSELVKKVEDYFEGKGFEHINLTTHEFQAPNFYKKMRF